MFGDVAFAQTPFASLGSGGGGQLNGNILEAVLTSSTVTARGTFPSFVNEAITADAQQGATTTFQVVNSESASSSALFNTANNTFNATVTATANATANSLAGINFVALVSEAVSALDTSIGGLQFSVSISEAASALEDMVRGLQASGSISEGAIATSDLTAFASINADVTGIQLYVSIGGVLIWVITDDSQTPNWQNINTVQAPDWNILAS